MIIFFLFPKKSKIPIDIYIDASLVTSSKTSIGNGAKGNVYRETMDGRGVAVKVLKMKTRNKRRMEEEASKLAKLWNRGGIVNFLGIIEEDNITKIVTEYLTGGTLKDFVASRGEDIGWAGKHIIISKVLNALKICHDSELTHCDLKCENIIMDHDLNPKICDFGCSIFAEDQNRDANRIGTDRWKAPEMYNNPERNDNEARKKWDIYAFGIVCWEIINNGTTPFAHIKYKELRDYVKQGGHPGEMKDCPDNLKQIVEQCIKFDSVERYFTEDMNKVNYEHILNQISIVIFFYNNHKIDKIRDMLILMAKENYLIAKQLLGAIECDTNNFTNAKRWIEVIEEKKYSSLFEIARINVLEELKYIYKKALN